MMNWICDVQNFEPDVKEGKANGEICSRCEDHLQTAGA